MSSKVKYFVITSALFLALSITLQGNAYAYVDPGSGLLAFQSFSAVVTGVIFYFRRRLKSFFERPGSGLHDGEQR